MKIAISLSGTTGTRLAEQDGAISGPIEILSKTMRLKDRLGYFLTALLYVGLATKGKSDLLKGFDKDRVKKNLKNSLKNAQTYLKTVKGKEEVQKKYNKLEKDLKKEKDADKLMELEDLQIDLENDLRDYSSKLEEASGANEWNPWPINFTEAMLICYALGLPQYKVVVDAFKAYIDQNKNAERRFGSKFEEFLKGIRAQKLSKKVITSTLSSFYKNIVNDSREIQDAIKLGLLKKGYTKEDVAALNSHIVKEIANWK